ncbi:CLUMA_CG012781, isoform A [Clunio marinus]|uniref:CLUMA_CG012781, isoform A n=1 Tax=Clunio marinus TaxID=568069 RepID=A0A1J1IGS2_9DIPT|nr:CLUMA_CG012781, isoform A [Clunio marinus]
MEKIWLPSIYTKNDLHKHHVGFNLEFNSLDQIEMNQKYSSFLTLVSRWAFNQNAYSSSMKQKTKFSSTVGPRLELIASSTTTRRVLNMQTL